MTVQIHNPAVSCILLGDQLYDVRNDIVWFVSDLHGLTYNVEYTISYKDRELVLTHIPDYRMEDYILIRRIDV